MFLSRLFFHLFLENGISCEGAIYLSEMLLKNNSITDISLFNNSIEEKGCKEIANVISKNYRLKRLNLGCKKFNY